MRFVCLLLALGVYAGHARAFVTTERAEWSRRRSAGVTERAWRGAGGPAIQNDGWVPKEKRRNAPKLSLRDLEDQQRQLARLTGKVVVVNFWATWCGPCRGEMPEFTKIHTEYRDRGVEIVGAANEARAARDKVRAFVRDLEIGFPIWLEASLDHLEAFGVAPALPATVIVDRQGRIAARIRGVTDAAQLRALLDRVLLESPPSTPRTQSTPNTPSTPST